MFVVVKVSRCVGEAVTTLDVEAVSECVFVLELELMAVKLRLATGVALNEFRVTNTVLVLWSTVSDTRCRVDETLCLVGVSLVDH